MSAGRSGLPWWRAVVPIRGRAGHVIGTGVAVGPGRVLTALHVIDPEPVAALRVARHPVHGRATLPWRHYGPFRAAARASYERTRTLTGGDSGTVDLALLAVPGLTAPPLPVRALAIQDGELVTIGGYPNGRWQLTSGPVTGHDGADFIAHVLLGPGISGAPAVDAYNDLAGLLTMDHESAGAILVGPQLLDTFVHRTSALLAHLPT